MNSCKRSCLRRQKILCKKCRGFNESTRWMKKLPKRICKDLLERQNINFWDILSITVEKATPLSNTIKWAETKITINRVMPYGNIPATTKITRMLIRNSKNSIIMPITSQNRSIFWQGIIITKQKKQKLTPTSETQERPMMKTWVSNILGLLKVLVIELELKESTLTKTTHTLDREAMAILTHPKIIRMKFSRLKIVIMLLRKNTTRQFSPKNQAITTTLRSLILRAKLILLMEFLRNLQHLRILKVQWKK